jgi:hypothetical protein
MNQVLRKLSKLFFSKIDSSVAISIAGIHATIISILIGLGIACILHINTQMSEIETDSLRIAEEANHISFSPAWFNLMSLSYKFLENWSSQDDQIQFALTNYFLDPTGEFLNKPNVPPLKVYFSDLGLNHTEFKLCLMGALILRKPFPERMVMKNGKHIGLQPSPTIIFSNMKELEEWKISIEDKFRFVVHNINWFGTEPFIQGFDWNQKINLRQKFWKNDSNGFSPETLAQFRELPKEFCSNVKRIYDIARTLDDKLKRFHYLQKVSPSNIIIIITLIGAIITFFSGVIIPIIHPNIYKIFIVWIPTLFYSYFMVYLAIKVFAIL